MKIVAKRKWNYPLSQERLYAKYLVAYVQRKFKVIQSFVPELREVILTYGVQVDDDSDTTLVNAHMDVVIDQLEKAVESPDVMRSVIQQIFQNVDAYALREFNAITKSLFGFPLPEILRVTPPNAPHVDAAVDDEIAKYKDLWVQQNLDLIKSIDTETMQKIRNRMAERIIHTVDVAQLTKYLIQDIQELAGVEIRRATLIGVDQVGKLNGQLAQFRQEFAGISEYRWETAHDSRVRPAHRLRQGKIFKWSNPPPDGHPGYPIRCRCVALPVIDLDKIPVRPKVGRFETIQMQNGRGIINTKGGTTLQPLGQAKKRDHKIFITDTAIEKVGYVPIPGLTDKVSLSIQEEHKAILSIAKNINNSNEVLSIVTTDMTRKVRVLGTEYTVDPSTSPEAYGILSSSKPHEVAYLHNHPSTNTFSLPDILTFIRYSQIGIISVVTNQGEVYILRKTKKYEYNKVKDVFGRIFLLYKDKKISHNEAVKLFLKECYKGGIAYVKSK